MFSIFSTITPLYLLYLFYGAAFLFLGVSIAAKDMKGSDLKLADSLWLLGAFGFFHGFREWLELLLIIEGTNLSPEQMIAAKAAAVLLMVISFMFLLQFGISLVSGLDVKRIRLVKILPFPLFLAWALFVWYFEIRTEGYQVSIHTLLLAETGARFIFGFTGGLITSYSLIAYSREVMVLGRSVAKKLSYAGVAFIFYGLFAGLFSSGFSIINLPVPVEMIRGILAFFITYFIVNALNIFDIEMRKKIEQQARRLVQSEKLASLGQLAAGIAHEINNPLANASLCIQTLKKKIALQETGFDVVEKLDAVERNIDRASTIAQELLQFSRPRESEAIPFNINRVIQNTLTLMQCKLSKVTVPLDLAPVPDILGDPGKLEQVLINVLSNSIEAMPDGGTISIATAVQEDMLIVKVCDTGTGIESDNLSLIFDPFFTTKEIGNGTGLGLSICHGIIRQHGGNIEVASKPGSGTVLSIKLPIRERYEKDTDRR
jgi:two-component system, NtrC family, sensor kinase